ncbi:hypothetical protein [Clostridium brassicae]|uniref:Dipeptidylpeptidase IV N-terminal domain-containing protein n=1 Tax=Clostridium brassicae TaxID=2999072 RepID=A0ABT4D8S0_9CLOT|nr:hypothetical protein [Clostridium brassicae]MCY6958553.1 hypothetical protein [Clostridium brassicae]
MDDFAKDNNVLLNNVSMKVILTLFVCMIFICIIFTGCIKSVKNKVVIIPEDNNEEDQIKNKVNEDFSIKKIYKYKVKEESDDKQFEFVNFGWIDYNNIISLKNGKELNKIDYRYNILHNINNDNNVLMGVLSPKGSSLVYYTEDKSNINNKIDIKIYLLDINSQKTKLIYNYQFDGSPYTKFKWSKQSKYISFIVEKKRENYLVVYDTVSNVIHETKIKTINPNFLVFIDAIVSDDGKEVSLVYYYNRLYYFCHKYLNNKNILIDNTDSINLTDQFSYRNYSYLKENSLIYLDENHNLYKYDSNMKKIIKIAENIDKFEVSRNSMYIAYTEYDLKSKFQDIYVGKLTNYGIIKRKLVYKNIGRANMKWSPDNKKLLLDGEYININDQRKNYLQRGEKYIITVEFDDEYASHSKEKSK